MFRIVRSTETEPKREEETLRTILREKMTNNSLIDPYTYSLCYLERTFTLRRADLFANLRLLQTPRDLHDPLLFLF
jgi:hypothetical protein